MADFTIKQGDTEPILENTLYYPDGTTVDLSGGATVKFVMRALTVANVTTNLAATILNAGAGIVSYQPTVNDTAIAGQYVACWVVTFPGGQVQTFPGQGLLEVTVEENILTPGGQMLVGLGEVKDHLRIPSTSRAYDNRLLAMIQAAAPVVESITGPILQHIYQNETYDGGSWFIALRHRPAVEIHSVTEYRGNIAYQLTQVPTPDLGTIYSYMYEPPGRIVRRTVGGGITPFPPGADQVFVTYTAGYLQTPPEIREGVLELIRVNFQPSEQGRHPAFGAAADQDVVQGREPPIEFFVPPRVRQMLMPKRRHPSVA